MLNCINMCGVRGSTAEDATQDVINVQIPALRDLCAAGELSIDNIDVFCERGVFDTDSSRRILCAGKDAGWKLNFHGDELSPMNSGEVSCAFVWSFCGVAVITCASHAQGPRFDPGQKHFFKIFLLLFLLAQLAGELGAHAVSHLENVSVAGIEAMAQASTVAVLLPTTAYILRLQHPPARQMIERGELVRTTVLAVC